MHQIATRETGTGRTTRQSSGGRTTRFTQRFAIGAAIFYTVLFIAAAIASPEVLRYALAWALWFVVMVSAAVTYAAGRHIGRQPTID